MFLTELVSSDDLPVLVLKELSVCLVDCMKTPGLSGETVRQEQSFPSVEVELEEDNEQLEADGCSEKPRSERCRTDLRADISLCKEEEEALECDNRGVSWVEIKAEETDELQPGHIVADGTLLVFQEDDGGSDGVTWVIQDYELSESLKSAMLSHAGGDSEVRQEEGDCGDTRSQHRNINVTTAEQQDAEDEGASESRAGGKRFFKIKDESAFYFTH